MSGTKLAPLDKKYQQSSYARMGNRMATYRKFLGTPSKVNMMNTLQDCLHDIYSKRPADPLLALSLRLQKKISNRTQQNTDQTLVSEVSRLSDENHRLRLLLGPEGMDMAESMEKMQVAVQEERATIIGLNNSKNGLEAEIVALKQRLAKMQNIINEKDSLIAQYAKSLNKLYGCDETEAVIKIQALRRGAVQRQVKSQESNPEPVQLESDSSDDSDDDHHFDGEIEHIDQHLSVGHHRKHQVKKARARKHKVHHLVVRQVAGEDDPAPGAYQVDSDAVDFRDLDREIDAMLSDDEHELDDKLNKILGEVDIDDAIEAATKIQALHRGNAARASLDDDDDEDVQPLKEYLATLSGDDVEKAVLKIQAVARGRIVRTHLEEDKIHTGPVHPDVEALEEFLADADDGRIRRSASKIQAGYRGRRDRRRVANKRQQVARQNKAAADIQRIYRGKSTRAQVQRRRLSTKKPQSAVQDISDVVVGPDETF